MANILAKRSLLAIIEYRCIGTRGMWSYYASLLWLIIHYVYLNPHNYHSGHIKHIYSNIEYNSDKTRRVVAEIESHFSCTVQMLYV